MFNSLAPGFLIASPPLGDPNFDRTVVLLAMHNEDGALGFVVNREAPITVRELFEHAGYEGAYTDEASVWMGGPVQRQSGWVISDNPKLITEDEFIEVGARLRVSSSRSAFDALAEQLGRPGADTSRNMVVLGYSGWAPEQLEAEIARGAWLPTPLDDSILFDVPPEERWERAYALLGLTPGHLMSMNHVGSA